MHSIDAQAELARIRKHKILSRRKSYRVSRLSRFRAELVELRRAGASYPELATWLRRQRRVKVSHTTVMRYLKKLPEMEATDA